MLKAISFAFLVLLFSRSLSVELKQTGKFSTNLSFDSLANLSPSASLDSPSKSLYSSSNLSADFSSFSSANSSFDSLLNLSSNLPSNLSSNSSHNLSPDASLNPPALNSIRKASKPNKISLINSTESTLNLLRSDRLHHQTNRTNSGDLKDENRTAAQQDANQGAKSIANRTADKEPLADKANQMDRVNQTAAEKASVNGPTSSTTWESSSPGKISHTNSALPSARTNGTTSSVVHLLSNEDIQEYQIKRKEEDNLKLELYKAKSNSKVEKQVQSRKGKLEEEKNEINHLQEIDLIDESLKDELKDLKEVTKPQLIILSLDAMRPDYIRMFKSHMDNFQRMIKLGVSASFGLKPAYITQTFPSHYSIVTGLYEEVNGIIDNHFYDPLFNETFKPFAMKSKFFGGEPIWNTAVKQGLESRVYFWPGSEVQINGYSPTEFMKFDLTTPIKDQVEKVIEWAENGTDLCMIYHGQPDFAGHNFGIGSKEMITAIKEINLELGVLIDYVKQKNINLIVTSDHGMVHFDRSKLVVLEDYLDFRDEIVRIPQFGSIAALQVKEGKLDQVMAKLSEMPFTKCYKKKDIPEHYHYKLHYRIQQIICIPELSAYIIRTKDDPTPTFGIHGYDNRNPRMRTVFYAIGPDFKQNSITHPFENVNLYSLFAHILQLNPAPNNGSIHNLKHLLSETSLARLI